MSRIEQQGFCEHCAGSFTYYLIHSAFNESAYAYCARCGGTALLDTRHEARPGIRRHRRITREGESTLQPCPCGGAFRARATPRCPHCKKNLSAQAARSYIEANAPGTRTGWKWQGNWRGLYAIVIENRCMRNNWSETSNTDHAKYRCRSLAF